MKKLIYLFTLNAFIANSQSYSQEVCMKAWIYFDLGNTLVDTKTHSYNPIFYMRDVSSRNEAGELLWKDGRKYLNAKNYIDRLKRENFVLGMITDVPERWGVNYPEAGPILDYPSAKIRRLFDFLAGKVPEDNTSWKDEVAEFDFKPFGDFEGEGSETLFKGELILPQKDTERKSPNAQGIGGSSILFERAVARAQEKGCKVIYQGEDVEEMKLAEGAGMIPFLVGKTSKKYFYLPPEKIEDYLESYIPGQWQGLGDNDFE